MAAVLLLLTLVDEELLLHIHLLDRNLLWYIAVFSGILAISRAFIPTPEQSVLSPDRAMRKVRAVPPTGWCVCRRAGVPALTRAVPRRAVQLVAYTHYMPKRWRGRFNTYDVRDEFLELYQFKVVLFLQEILGAVTTPLVLLFTLPRRAHDIVEFVRRVSISDDNLGSVCGYALFNMRKFGNAKYGAPVHASKLWRSRQGKMEKSLLSFQANNPEWSATKDGVELLQQLTRFQAEQSAAIAGRPMGMSMGMGMGMGMGMPMGMAGTGFLGQPGATLPQGMPGWGIGASDTLSVKIPRPGDHPTPTGAASTPDLTPQAASELNAFGSASLLGRGGGRHGGRPGSRSSYLARGTPAVAQRGGTVGSPTSAAAATGGGGGGGSGVAGTPVAASRRGASGTGTGASTGADAGAGAGVGAVDLATGGGGGDGGGVDADAAGIDARVPPPVRVQHPPPPSQAGHVADVTPHPPHPTHMPLPGSPRRAGGMLGGAAGMHAGRAMTGQHVWNPYEPMSAQSLLLPLNALTPEQQENHFFWLDRVRGVCGCGCGCGCGCECGCECVAVAVAPQIHVPEDGGSHLRCTRPCFRARGGCGG